MHNTLSSRILAGSGVFSFLLILLPALVLASAIFPGTAWAAERTPEEIREEIETKTGILETLSDQQVLPDSSILSANLSPGDWEAAKEKDANLSAAFDAFHGGPLAVSAVAGALLFIGFYGLFSKIRNKIKKEDFIR